LITAAYLEQRIKSFTVTGVTAVDGRRRAEVLKVDYRIIVDGTTNGIAV
jgi:hypothetical protein